MAFVEKTGKTVDEAVAEALKALNITADQAEIEVLEEGKKAFFGIFGGKDAKVRVTVKEAVAKEEAEAQEEAAPAAMLTGFVRNKYLVMCIPFFLRSLYMRLRRIKLIVPIATAIHITSINPPKIPRRTSDGSL